MKTILLCSALIAAAGSAFGQGQIVFNNRVTGEVDARIFNVDGVTALGAGWTAEVWAGSSADSLAVVAGSQTTFRTTSLAANGYVSPLTVTIPGFDGGTTPTLQIRVWQTSAGSYAASTIRGSSTSFTATLGGGSTVITVPNMVGLQSFSVAVVPEPGVMSLAAIGGLGLLVLRRKNT